MKHRALVLPLLAFSAFLHAECRPLPFSVGITPNLYVTDAGDADAPARRLDQVKAAGANFLFYSPTWNDLETSPGVYRNDVFDYNVRRAAERGMDLLVNFKTVDTYVRTTPADLSALDWDHPTVLARFEALLNHFLPRLEGRGRWISLGNEVDLYLSTHPGEGHPFLAFFQAGAARVRAVAPGSYVSMTLTSGVGQYSQNAPLLDAGDFLSLTYYPINGDFTVRNPSVVSGDLDGVVERRRGKAILFQEIGYPSGVDNNSSPVLQAQFYGKALDALKEHPGVFLGANFMLLADLSLASATAQAVYYGNTTPEFISFLQTLGVVDDTGTEKPAWDVFSSRARALAAGSDGCEEDEVVAFPVPWDARRHAGQPLRFENLPTEGTLRILTLSGTLVAEVPILGGRAAWDLKDSDGNAVASGVYMAVEKGGNSRGKFAVVR